MKIDKHQKLLKAIKLKYAFSPTKCHACGEEYVREYMWTFYRYGINHRHIKHHYCQHCMHSVEEVLQEIATDNSPFGLVGVDNRYLKEYALSCQNSIIYE